jgi:hypothetical protein
MVSYVLGTAMQSIGAAKDKSSYGHKGNFQEMKRCYGVDRIRNE